MSTNLTNKISLSMISMVSMKLIVLFLMGSAVSGCNSPTEGQQGEYRFEDQSGNETTLRQMNGEYYRAERGEDGRLYVTNPDDHLVIVNKQRNLPSGYEPDDLSVPNVPAVRENMRLREDAARALEQLFKAAREENIIYTYASGYRSYEWQRERYDLRLQERGQEYVDQFIAYPGQSEHQTGLAADITSPVVDNRLTQEFGQTREGIWLEENAHKFGFIIRYPEGMEHITGYAYEPWHLRYVGREYAGDIYESGKTLEEYFGVVKNE